jgi:parallel beta-helix repeat protein
LKRNKLGLIQHNGSQKKFQSIRGDIGTHSVNTDNSYHVVTGSYTDANTILDGFTITAGNANAPIEVPFPGRHGGGMFSITANCTVNNCTFVENSAGHGGAIWNGHSDFHISNCTFLRNAAGQYGGGMNNYYSSPEVTNCTFNENTAVGGGGGMSDHESSNPTILNCRFISNRGLGSGNNAGGLYNIGSSPEVTNCLFVGNSAQWGGGISNIYGSSPAITNCTLTGNSATGARGGINDYNDSYPVITNCILWGNSAPIDPQIGDVVNSEATVNYSVVQGGWSGAGALNIDADPLFVDANGPDNIFGTEDDNLRLLTSSPCIDAADNNAVPGGIETDLDGRPRFLDDPWTADTGNGTAPIVDMGAYEHEHCFYIVDPNLKAAVEEELGLTDPNATDMLALTELDAGNIGIVYLTGLEYATNLTELYLNDNQLTDIFALTELTNLTVLDLTGNPLNSETSSDYLSLIFANNPGINLSYDALLIYVDAGVVGNNDGSSWADAYNYLQDALTATEPNLNYEIWVAQGTYRPDENTSYPSGTGSRYETFWLDGVEIYGGFPTGGGSWASRDPNIYKTILSGDLNEDDEPNFVNNGDNSYTIVTSDGTNYKILDGFTITASNGNGEHPYNFGGGMRSAYGLTMTNCTFIDNLALEGGGMLNGGNAIITNCKFIGNLANGDGGGMCNSGNPTLTNCTFVGNSAATSYGGGMYNAFCSPTLINCSFIRNSATTWYGGGICNQYCTTRLKNCTFSGNLATNSGGGIINLNESSSILNNCIFWGNTAPTGAQIYNDETSSSTVSFSNVQGGWTGTSNINTDPLFVDPNGLDHIAGTEDDNLRLSHGSPCIDAGDNTAVPGGIVTDLDGRPRFLDDPVTVDTGNGTPPIVDMGAYEYKPTIYVDANATGANNGTSWEDAYNYLQDALADPNLIGPAEIWVAEGTYRPDEDSGNPSGTGDRTATFQLINSVAIYGGFPSGGGTWASRDPKTYKTILSGDLAGNDVYVNDPCDLHIAPTRAENSYHVVTGSYTDANTILDGFTITGGNANAPPEVPFPGRHGGGMFNLTANCTINNCMFVENSARNGGGMAIGTGCNYSHVSNCTFLRNAATTSLSGANANGGGMDLYQSDNVVVTNCTFSGNVCSEGAGGMSIISCSSSPTVTNCTFTGNSAGFYGGGGIWDHNSSPTLTNCIFWGNTVPTGPQINNTGTGSPTVSYSDVQGGWAGTGSNNIDANPLIWDTKVRGRLLKDSPCRNAGDPSGDYSGQVDIDGQPRVLEGRVDIGADELPPPIQNIDTTETYDTIQDAIDDANNGETIVVQYGTYTGAGNAGINFYGKAITLRSAEPNEPYAVAATIIDCENNYEIGVYFQNGEEPNSVLNGFTVINALAEGIGGGIYCMGSSPTIKNCILRNNTAGGGCGIHCSGSANPTIDGGTIRNNSPDGVYIEAGSSVRILGVVHIFSNDVVGQGTLQMGTGGSLDLDKAKVFTNMSGPGTITVALGAEATIDGNCVIDLGDPCDTNVKGTIDSKGLLKVAENAKITKAIINITKASFKDKASISKSDIHVDSNAPYGSVFADPNTSFVDVNIYADGDRYMDLEPNIFDGNFINVRIFVTITEGVGQLQGGLLECRGDVSFADVNSCDPNNTFFCRANPGTIQDCNTKTWTLERLELIPGAKVNLTNRFPFQPPYNPGTDYDVVYVKELILRQGAVLNTSFNYIYYGSLIKEPNAVIKNEPLLGFSLINIALDDQTEFIVRVTSNNYTDYNDPSHNRVYVERIAGLPPDSNGMMQMSNLLDLDPCSPDYNDTINARAKGLFSKSNEGEILIRFEYLFGAVDSNTELVIYLSDIPELGDVNDPNDYVEVARLLPPLPGQPGSVGSGRFGVFKQYVPTGGLNFIRGTRVEFILLGGNGVYMYINNWDPGLCGICLDLNDSDSVDEEDFLTVLSNYGGATDCLSGPFGEDGTVDCGDICGWDWGLSLQLNCCGPLPLTGGGKAGGSPSAMWNKSTRRYQMNGFSGDFNDILVCGKRGTAYNILKDCLYVFDGDGQYLDKSTPAPDRGNMRLVEDFDGNVYQVNSKTGITDLNSDEVIVGSAQLSGIIEHRYGTSATVYVGLQGTGSDSYGRPISDAAFDPDFADNNYVYVVPVVVEPYGEEAYVAAAKLLLSASSYSVVKLYDDPNAANPGDNRNLDALHEVEVDNAGNLYVLNAYGDNESDILWKYNASSGAMIECLVLGNPSSANYVPSPTAMHLSTAQDKLYLASLLNAPEAASSTIYGFSTSSGTLTLAREITVNGMGHVTGITEDPTTGTLWVAGFSIVPNAPANPYLNFCLFYEPNLAEVPIYSNNVNAICTLDADTERCTPSGGQDNDLVLPLSIVWTGAIRLQVKCGGADLDSSGDVDLEDFGVFAQHWLETYCVVPDWCGGADLDPYIRNRGQVDLADLAIFVQNWLESGCLE